MNQPTRTSRLGRKGLFAVLAAVAILASFPASAKPPPKDKGKAGKAQSEFFPFEYGIDIASWFWERQVDQEVPPPGVPNPGPVSQRVRGPNPYTSSTLPVAVYQGAHERMSAIRFDLVERGVTPGSEISKAVLFIEESPTGEREPPPLRPETAKIEACLLTELLSAGENEEFEDRPAVSEEDTDCVEGKREVQSGAAALWTFDLTKLAKGWGKDPFGNNGVMLLGVLQNTRETWQVSLRIPTKESTATTENDYELTKNRARLQLAFVPGKEPKLPPAAPPAVPAGASGTSSSSSGGGSFPSIGGIAPSTDLTGASGGGTFPSVDTDIAPAPPLTTVPQAITAPQPTEPRLPGYVWLLVPAGLLALAAVRSVVLEPVGGTRADGVIAAIRRRNAERRGRTLHRPIGFLARAVTAARRGAAGTRTTIGKLTKSVGRKR